MPVALVTQTMPLVALTPLLVLILGRGPSLTLWVTISVTFFPAFVTLAQGLALVPRSAEDLPRAYGASRWTEMRMVTIPASLPYLFAATRLTVPRALLGVMIAEWLATGKGLGNLLNQSRGFLDYGDEAMKPLVLHDIAEAVGMHESTISRVTTQKFMHTPRGIYELKYFFSSHVSTSEGGECSSTAIRAIIKKLVAAENAKKPLSDSKIAGLLEAQGIQVARRTVAKYRESLGIAPSSERKRLI